MFIKTRQIHIHRGLMMELDSNLTEDVSIENYEIRISRSDFMYIHVYLCRISFLTTLDIYKIILGHHKWCKLMESDNTCILWPEKICPSSSYSL